MKIKTVALLLGFYLQFSSIYAQKYEVYDSLTRNRTIYTRLNDSVYKVQSYFKDKLMAKANIIYPDLTKHFECPKIYLVEYNLKLLKYHLTDTCDEYNLLGEHLHRYIIQNNAVIKHWEFWPYKDKFMRNYYEAIGPKTTKIEFNKQHKIIYKETKIDNKSIDYEIRIGDEKYKYQLIYNDSINRYLPHGKKNYLFYSRFKISSSKTFSKKDQLLTLSQNFDQKGNLTQETEYKYNKKNRLIKKITSNYYQNKKSAITTDIYKYNKDNFLIEEQQHTFNAYDNKIQMTHFWKRNFKTKTIYYNNNYNENKLVFKGDQFILTHYFKKHKNYLYDTDSVIYYINDSNQHIHFYKNGHIFLKRQLVQRKIYNYSKFELQDFQKTGYLITDMTHSHYNNQFRLNEIPTSHKIQCDSFFNIQNQLIELHTLHKDTLIRYKIVDNKKQMVYHSHFLRIAKDVLACKEGLKTLNNEWLEVKDPKIIQKFDVLECIQNDSNTLYIGHNDEKISVFDWKGNNILNEVEGLKTEYISHYDKTVPIMIQLSESDKNQLKLKHGLLFWLSDDKNKDYKLIAENGRTILQFPGYFFPFEAFKKGNISSKIGAVKTQANHWQLVDFKGQLDDMVFYSVGQLTPYVNVYYNKENYFLDSNYQIIPNTNYIIIQHRDNTHLWLRDMNGNKLFNIETAEIEKHIPYDFVNLLYNHYPLVRDKDRKLGLYTKTMDEIIPVKYSQIKNFNRYYLAQNLHDIDLYLRDSGFIKTIQCDTIYNLFPNYNYTGTYTGDFRVLKKDNLYGLVDIDFNIVVEPIYSEILRTNSDLIFIKEDGTVDFYFNITNKSKHIPTYPKDHATSYSTLYGQKVRSGYIDYLGNFKEGFDFNYIQPNRFKLTVTRLNKKPLGLINCLGENVKDLSEYKEIFEENNTIFMLNKDDKIGVLNIDGQEVVKPEYYFINYNPELDILWFIDKKLSRSYTDFNYYKFCWKLKDLSNNYIFTDTFASPFYFKDNSNKDKFSVFENNRNRFGMLLKTDEGLKKLIEPLYTHNYHINQNTIAFYSKQLGTKIVEIDNFSIKNLSFDKIQQLNDREFLALKGNCFYLLDSVYQVKDSSTLFFSDKRDRLNNSDNLYFYDGDSNIGLPEDDDEIDIPIYYDAPRSKLINFNSKELQKPLHNLTVCIALINPKLEKNAFAKTSFFPSVNHQDYGYLHHSREYFHEMNYQVIPPFIAFSDEYKPKVFTFKNIEEFTYIYFKCFSEKTMTIIANSEIERSYSYINIYNDSNEIYTFTLTDLLVNNKIEKFNQIISKKLTQIDKKDMPCFVTQDYFEMFNNQFAIQGDNMRLYLGEGYDYYIEMPLKDFESVLKPFWKMRLLD